MVRKEKPHPRLTTLTFLSTERGIIMKRLTVAECPKTRAEFIRKYHEDRVFRQKCDNANIQVVFDSVIFPTGKIANARVK